MDEAWLSTVRLARDIGDISSLFPPGIERLVDLPFTIHNAILAALGFLTFDQLPKEERPPRKIWMDPDAMTAWWEEVERMREEKAKGHEPSDFSENALRDKLLVGFKKRAR